MNEPVPGTVTLGRVRRCSGRSGVWGGSEEARREGVGRGGGGWGSEALQRSTEVIVGHAGVGRHSWETGA